MKKIVLAALAAATAFQAVPAFAADGVVNLTGTVADKCVVTNAGTPGTAAFGGTVDLGQLDASDGKLETSATLASRFAGAGASNLQYRVICTTPKTAVTVDADDLTTSATATTGYANTVRYNAHVALAMVGGDETVSNDSFLAPTGTSQTFAKRMATSTTNVAVSADTFRTPGASDVMLAGTYSGKITITVAPAN